MSTHGLLSQSAGDPDWTRPARYDDAPSPEQRLWCAVLKQALKDALGPHQEQRDKARAWLLGNDEPEELRRVCIWAGISFDALIERACLLFTRADADEQESARVEKFLADDSPEPEAVQEQDIPEPETSGLRPVELLDDEEMTGELF